MTSYNCAKLMVIQGFFFGHHYAQNRNFRLRLPSTFLNNLFWNVPMKATPKHKNLETTLSFNLGTLETQCVVHVLVVVTKSGCMSVVFFTVFYIEALNLIFTIWRQNSKSCDLSKLDIFLG